jgi:hypothetical protein
MAGSGASTTADRRDLGNAPEESLLPTVQRLEQTTRKFTMEGHRLQNMSVGTVRQFGGIAEEEADEVALDPPELAKWPQRVRTVPSQTVERRDHQRLASACCTEIAFLGLAHEQIECTRASFPVPVR